MTHDNITIIIYSTSQDSASEKWLKYGWNVQENHAHAHDRTFQPDDEGYGELDLLAGSDDAIGYRGTVHYSTKYVHQYRLHLDNKEIRH